MCDVAVALATPLEHGGVRVRVGHVHRSLETFLRRLEGHAGLVRTRNRVVAKETIVCTRREACVALWRPKPPGGGRRRGRWWSRGWHEGFAEAQSCKIGHGKLTRVGVLVGGMMPGSGAANLGHSVVDWVDGRLRLCIRLTIVVNERHTIVVRLYHAREQLLIRILSIHLCARVRVSTVQSVCCARVGTSFSNLAPKPVCRWRRSWWWRRCWWHQRWIERRGWRRFWGDRWWQWRRRGRWWRWW